MKLENRCVVPVDRDTAWNLVMDLPRVAPCVPGLSALEADGDDQYSGTLQAQAGPMRVNLSGKVRVTAKDSDKGEAHFLLEAADRRIGGSVKTSMTLQLASTDDGQTELTINTDTAFMGALGTLGQPIIRRKAAATVEEFARNLAGLVASTG
ncbi:MAG: SRPBCC domain-containing protein [Chloroflexota bacterium]|nr:SRPBCC domain-containing protein [Chloroflexota bacterium]